MKIGSLNISGYVALAPMAGVADKAFREICARFGSAYTVGELTSSKGVSMGDRKSADLLDCKNGICPSGCQLFGNDPDIMASAAQKALEFSPDFIDINMGCPAPKVAGNGGGSALLRDADLAYGIVKAVVEAVNIPVTVKLRTGWDSDELTAVGIAVLCEKAGASAITVHGRTRKQMYAPPIDYDTIRLVKKSVSIPVIGNGDIHDCKSAELMFEKTGCDFLMVGRAAMGNPFIFSELNSYFNGSEYKPPDLEERLNVCKKQIGLMLKYKDEHIAYLESRKHLAWYLSGLHGAASLRRECGEIICMDDVERICKKALELNSGLW